MYKFQLGTHFHTTKSVVPPPSPTHTDFELRCSPPSTPAVLHSELKIESEWSHATCLTGPKGTAKPPLCLLSVCLCSYGPVTTFPWD